MYVKLISYNLVKRKSTFFDYRSNIFIDDYVLMIELKLLEMIKYSKKIGLILIEKEEEYEEINEIN